MSEVIKSSDVIDPEQVGSVSRVGKFQLFLEHLPEITRSFCALFLIGLYALICVLILFSKDADLTQYRQMAITAIFGLGTGALGFLFGTRQKDGE